MNLREALIQQAPSLALQRAAADEIARLDDLVACLRRVVDLGRFDFTDGDEVHTALMELEAHHA